jgi:hypothetical protein
MAGFSNLEHVTDGTPMLPQLFSDSEGGLLMQAAAYDVAGRMDGSGLYPLLANSNSVVSNSNWDEHANDALRSGTMALPQLLSSGSGSSNAGDHGLDVLDDAVSILQRISNNSDGPSSFLSGSLGNDVNPPMTVALRDNSSSSNAHVADDEDAPSSSSVVVAAEFAGLAEQLSELDSWIATSPFAVSGQSGVVDDGNWFDQFFPGFDEPTVL